MRRPSGNHALCLANLEQALAEDSETYGHLDLIAFGFPCVDISNANPKGKGLAGGRSGLFFEAMRIVRLLNPQWLLIENVPRLLSKNNGRDMAQVLQTLAECGYGWSYRILDSRYWGVAQRRRRVFIVGYFGGECPPEILFEPKSGSGDHPKNGKVRTVGVCLSTRDGERQDPTTETLVASVVKASDYSNQPVGQYGNENNLIASPVKPYGEESLPPDCRTTRNIIALAPTLTANSEGKPSGFTDCIVASTIGSVPRGNTSFIWQDTYIAEADPDRKRKVAGISSELHASQRGIVIGNAVTTTVATWIGKRIFEYELLRNK